MYLYLLLYFIIKICNILNIIIIYYIVFKFKFLYYIIYLDLFLYLDNKYIISNINKIINNNINP